MNKTKISLVIVLILCWEVVAYIGIFPEIAFPSFTEVFIKLYREIIKLDIIVMTFKSIIIIIFSLTASLIIALLVSYFATINKRISDIVDTFISILHPLPSIALLPLVILWFGVGRGSLIIILLHSTIWPLIISIRTGFNCIPKKYYLIASNYELSSFEKVYRIMIPSSIPYILNGIEIGWARSFRALISAEMIFGAMGSGIGWYLFERRAFMDTKGLFAGLLIVIIVGISVENIVFKKLEKLTYKRWGNGLKD
ncbi:ABC transporter permease [Helicovermis profundi]